MHPELKGITSALFAVAMYPLSVIIGISGVFYFGPYNVAGILTIGFCVFLFVLGRAVGEQQKMSFSKKEFVQKIMIHTIAGLLLIYLFILLSLLWHS